MNCEIKKLANFSAIAIFLITLLFLFAGCASNSVAVKETSKDTTTPPDLKIISDITTSENSEFIVVSIRGNRLLTYTSVKQPFPLGVLLYFPETALGDIDSDYMPDTDIISSIKASELTDKGNTSRVEILLKEDTSYEVTREDTGLNISFKKIPAMSASAEPEVANKEMSTSEMRPESATRLESIQATTLENSVNILVNADGTITDFKSFTAESPARIVFDIFNVTSPYKTEQSITVNSKWVKQVRHYGYPDRLRVVLDTTPEYLSAFYSNSVEKGLLINVGVSAEQPVATEQEELRTEASTAETSAEEAPTEVAASEAAATTESKAVQVNAKKSAWINRIDFSSEDTGKSTIIVGTTMPVKYDLKKINDKKLLLNLENTKLPDYRKRPLITTRFESAVDRITPFQTPAVKDSSLVSIELREAVPYFIEQTDDLLLLHFEASTVPPKSLDEAKLPQWKKVLTQVVAEAKEQEMKAVKETAPQIITGKYTGEKIALNFFETDIKNAFRILMDVSGKNFAIDKDVTGKVTLAFEKPVPWDQVLDLILKMNRLGMVYEGDIIRIATLKTLKDEDKDKAEQMASKQKVEAQQKALEPLVTEYIPVNYANANTDVLPHIVLSEGRGKVTVDDRNNQIIITDVAEMIKQAKITINQIDRVTPQVIIEARVVEASTNFAREIGTSWTGSVGPSPGSTYDRQFDIAAVNPPAVVSGAFGIGFQKITGTPWVLDATIAASETKGDVKIISAPKIVTLDNTAATIKQGLQYPIFKLDADGNTTTEYKDIALELIVTPHITPDNRVSMKVSVANNEIGPALQGGEQTFTTKEASTELLVNDGDTVIIGGIRKTRKENGESGVPGLKEIPLLGWLFKVKTKDDSLEELLIFITPRIVQLEQRKMLVDK
jgi:type IV pilus assembly protein PilQ